MSLGLGRWAALPALAGLLVVTGCGSSAATPAAALSRYVTQVNRIEKQLGVPLATVTRVGAAFSSDQSAAASALGALQAASNESTLNGAIARIASLRAKLAALPAPQPARHLRALLLELTDQQASLTRQTAKLIVFLPGLQAALRQLTPALVSLDATLRSSQASGAAAIKALYGRKAAALRAFVSEMERVLRRLMRLHPPLVARPAYVSEGRSIRDLAAAASSLAAALEAGRLKAVPALLAAFDAAVTGPDTVAAQRAQIAAVKAYDAEIRRLDNLELAAARERLRLSQTGA